MPSDRNGRPTGTWVDGQARVLEGEEKDRALDIFRKNYGVLVYAMVGLVGRMRGERNMTAVISIKFEESGVGAPGRGAGTLGERE